MSSKKKGKSGRAGKYAEELERLRKLNTINEVLKKSDIENAALTNTSKDSEPVNDNVIDNMLDRLNINRNATKDLEIIENLTKSTPGSRIVGKRHTKLTKTKRGIKVKRKIHLTKIKKTKQKGKSAKKKKR